MLVDERRRAELAMDRRARHDEDGSAREQWPPAARRISDARRRSGLTDVEVANRLAMTIDSYWDLEAYDSEAFTAVSLATLRELGRILDVPPTVLLVDIDRSRAGGEVTFDDIARRLADRVSHTSTTAEAFGDRIGWDIAAVLANPQTLATWDVEALYHVTKAVGLDWIAALPSPPTQG